MYLDAMITPPDLRQAGAAAALAEGLGFQGVWVAEIQHDPFLQLAGAALATSSVSLGTAIALAFPRSPTVIAYAAWDLARASDGRFILGLGTQVKAHIERRFGLEWHSPAAWLRDYVGAIRAVWRCWQTGERLRNEGEFYKLTLMTPFFSPQPLPDAGHQPPIYIAGVNRELCRLAGEVCDGFHVHPFHTAHYLREAILPWIDEGLDKAKRKRAEVTVCASAFAVVGRGTERDKAREETRRQIAFYASTPSYRTLLEMHGWEAQANELSSLARRGRWDEMGVHVSDEMLAAFAVEGETLADTARTLRERYDGLLDRVAFYMPFAPGERDEEWRDAVRAFAD